MILTPLYSRIAIPWQVQCPHGDHVIPDLLTELLDTTDKKSLLKGEAALLCPICTQPVTYAGSFLGDLRDGTGLPLVYWSEVRWERFPVFEQQERVRRIPRLRELLV